MTRAAVLDPPDHMQPLGSGMAETRASWISKNPDRCGGDACIRDTRIPVWVLVNYRRLSGSDVDLLRDYPSLTTVDLEAAQGYYAANAEEIDRANHRSPCVRRSRRIQPGGRCARDDAASPDCVPRSGERAHG